MLSCCSFSRELHFPGLWGALVPAVGPTSQSSLFCCPHVVLWHKVACFLRCPRPPHLVSVSFLPLSLTLFLLTSLPHSFSITDASLVWAWFWKEVLLAQPWEFMGAGLPDITPSLALAGGGNGGTLPASATASSFIHFTSQGTSASHRGILPFSDLSHTLMSPLVPPTFSQMEAKSTQLLWLLVVDLHPPIFWNFWGYLVA